jgi:hypothetical protein
MTNQPLPLPQVSREELKRQIQAIEFPVSKDIKIFPEGPFTLGKFLDAPMIEQLLALFDQHLQVAVNEAKSAQTQRIRELVGWEEEPDFDPGDATYGDSEHDHNAVIYGRNEAKGEIQGKIENELARLKNQPNTPNNDKEIS